MATNKRRKHGDGPVDSPAEFAKSRGDMLGSSSEFDKPIYLVAEQENERSVYSSIKVDAAAGGDEPLRARTVADLHNTEHGMSFVAAHSKHGSWIVGIGGRRYGSTIIFDPTTLETFRGPGIVSPKDELLG
ncbi:unnamed protein product [Urochloa humidicola]